MDALLRWIVETSVLALGTVFVICLAGAILFAWRRRRSAWREALSRTGSETLLVVAMALIVIATLLTPQLAGAGERTILLEPFWDLREALAGRQVLGRAIAEMVGNVLLFIPLGLAIALRWPTLSLIATIGAAVATSLVVEVGQALLAGGRMTDVTDVLMNGIGALIGALFIRGATSPQEPLTPDTMRR
jgi:glycopeptide antibiotics resistance protein